MTKVKSFVKETLARLTGDEKEVVAQKNYRKATSILNGQVAALKAKLVDAESAVEDAEEGLKAAKFPTTTITEGSNYLSLLNRAKENLADKKAELEHIQKAIAENEATLAEFEAEV